MGLLERLAATAETSFTLRFCGLSGDGEVHRASDLWAHADRVGAQLAADAPPSGRVGMVLTNTPEAVAALLGAWRHGLTPVSLPVPPRSASLADYTAALQRIAASLELTRVLLEPKYRRFVGDLDGLVTDPPALTDARTPPARPADAGGALIQFTSGSTADPKGVALSLDAVDANLAAILDLLEPRPGDRSCSWLPFSHDMGLIGALLLSWVAAGPDGSAGGELVVLRPEHFVMNPNRWLRLLSEHRITAASAPDFGWAKAAGRLRDVGSLDLSALRIALVGAEHIRADTLRTFAAATASAGFDERAFIPGYGLAEATFGVTGVRPADRWRSRTFDADRLGAGELVVDDGGRELVSCGPALTGMEVRIAPGATVGPIEIRSPSLLDGYLHATVAGLVEEAPPIRDGWLRTEDLGFLDGGELFVTGRADDVLVVAGRNLYATDLEAAAVSTGSLKSGGAAALGAPDADGWVLLIEPATVESDAHDVARAVRAAVVSRGAPAPSRVVVVPAGALPRTTSGKLQRHVARRLLADAAFEVRFELD